MSTTLHKPRTSNHRSQVFNLPVFLFEEDNIFILYCPALELTGYGNTEFEAWDSFKTGTQEYINYTTQHNTLKADLKRIGWHIDTTAISRLTPPSIGQILSENDDFSQRVNNLPFRKMNAPFYLPPVK